MENNIKELVDLIVAFFGLMATLIGIYFVLSDLTYTSRYLLNTSKNVQTRLKSEFFSPSKIRKHDFYLTVIAIFIAIVIGYAVSDKPFITYFTIFGVLVSYLLIMKWINSKRNELVLSVNYKCKTWYLFFRTEDGYIFRTNENPTGKNNKSMELLYFEEKDVIKHFSGYEDISKIDFDIR